MTTKQTELGADFLNKLDLKENELSNLPVQKMHFTVDNTLFPLSIMGFAKVDMRKYEKIKDFLFHQDFNLVYEGLRYDEENKEFEFETIIANNGKITIYISCKHSDDSEIQVYYNEPERQDAYFLMRKISNLAKEKVKKHSFYILKVDNYGFGVDEIEVHRSPKMDIKTFYGEEFGIKHEKIADLLKDRKRKGLYLFHGPPGTGKSSYIKFLIKKYSTYKDFIIIPSESAHLIGEPSFSKFLIKHKNCVLIIEDADSIIKSRERQGSTFGLSSLLNLTDGIVADALCIQVIITFNMSKPDIDPALYRKGRLLESHEFNYLKLDEAIKLGTMLKKDVERIKLIENEEYSLANISNLDNGVEFAKEKIKAVGFRK